MIRLIDTTRRFGDRLAVDRVSLEVAEGETLAVLEG